jgi:hypothetical protein
VSKLVYLWQLHFELLTRADFCEFRFAKKKSLRKLCDFHVVCNAVIEMDVASGLNSRKIAKTEWAVRRQLRLTYKCGAGFCVASQGLGV